MAGGGSRQESLPDPSLPLPGIPLELLCYLTTRVSVSIAGLDHEVQVPAGVLYIHILCRRSGEQGAKICIFDLVSEPALLIFSVCGLKRVNETDEKCFLHTHTHVQASLTMLSD